jgi:hypothetical protein
MFDLTWGLEYLGLLDGRYRQEFYYVLWRWACQGERVVLRRDQYENEDAFLLCPDGAFQLDTEQWKEEGRNPRTR